MSRQKLYKAFIALQQRLGIEPTWSFHRGHDDLETTAGYLHAVAADKVAVIEAIGQLAGNSA